MAAQSVVQLRPGHRPGHRRGLNRSPLFLLLGGLTLLSLCFFVSHLPTLPLLTGFRPFGGNAGEPQMTSSGAVAPHHVGASTAELILELVELAKANKLETNTMEYGTNKHPPFKDDPPLLVKDLPQEHIPSYTPPSLGVERINGKRLVVVGDVHGQTAALKALLEKIGFDHKHGDHLVLAGDMITKGPDSKGVVKLAMAVGASAVRGNQEDRVLAAARELHRWSAIDEFKSDRASEAEKADGEVGIETRRKNHAHRVAESLTRAQLAWLRSLPIILRIGHLPDAASPPWNASTLAVVHGGLVPGVHLEKQDPWAVMNMRSLKYPRKGKGGKKGKHHSESQPESPVDHDEDQTDPTTTTDGLTLTPDAVAVPVDTHGGEPWSHVLKKKKQKGHRYAYGLDSGCGHGKQLTALVIEAVGDPAGRGAIRHHIEQVDCADPGVVVQTVEGLGGVEEGEEGSQRVME